VHQMLRFKEYISEVKTCNCWNGYKRVPGTKPCEPGSCVKESAIAEGGLWDNIHAKQKRIKAGSGERMRKPGSKGAPTDAALKTSQNEEVEQIDELDTKTLKSYVNKNLKSNDTSSKRDTGLYTATNKIAKTQATSTLDKKVKTLGNTSARDHKNPYEYEASRSELKNRGSHNFAGRKTKTEEVDLEETTPYYNKPSFLKKMSRIAKQERQAREKKEAEAKKPVKEETMDEAAIDAKGHKSSTGGLTQKGRDAYNAKGANLQAPVTTPPSKLKAGSKAYNRRKSFCARMSGVDGPMKDEKGRPTRKALALRKWNC